MKTEVELKTALRDSKTASRPYVIVNPLLAKHLPAMPSQVLEYFSCLGEKVAATCRRGESVLVIGFAETATAVGAAVSALIDKAVYVHTTRESLQCRLVSEFLEEHSHARNQALYLREELKDLSDYDRIVFVEDEITTGKTIRNFLKSVNYNKKITVSALVFNSFDENLFSQYDAEFVCLQKTGYVNYLEFNGLSNPRSGVYSREYQEKCLSLAEQINSAINEKDLLNKDILVMGTEEFMYPALVLGRALEKIAKSVKSQSTTRSPILARHQDGYPFYSRCSFASVYDNSRVTYLYNLENYDTVIVITDSLDDNSENHAELLQAIQNNGNQTIYFVRVRNAD